MSDKKVGEMTLAEAQAADVKSMEEGVKLGIFTQPGVDFVNELTALITKHLEAHGLSAAEKFLLHGNVAELGIAFQGVLDTRGKDKRQSPAALKFMLDSIALVAKMKELKADGSTKPSFGDFDGPSSPVPNLYN
jgi:hypothetical protein